MVNVSRQTLHVAIRQGILRMVQPAPGIQRVKLSDLHHWNANRATYALDAQERRKETLRKRHRATA
jgi:hypothetical protein